MEEYVAYLALISISGLEEVDFDELVLSYVAQGGR